MAIGSLLLAGCAKHPVSLEVPPPTIDILTRPGKPGLVIAAPPGTSDPDTADIATEISRRTGFGLVVTRGRRLATPEAQQIRDEYERRVAGVAGDRLQLYVEIDAGSRQESAGRIEIATVGVDQELGLQLRALLELMRDAHLRARPDARRLDVLVEPVERLFYLGSGARRDGTLRRSERALHIELPRAARRDFRDVYTAILADFVAEAATLRPLR